MNRFARKVDANQSEIVRALEAIGIRVIDMSGVGEGIPDLCCLSRGCTHWIEIKNPARPPSARKLTIAQVRFHEAALNAGVTIHVVETVQQALAVFGARMAA